MTNRILPGVLDSVSRGYDITSSVLLDRFANNGVASVPGVTPGYFTRTFGTPTAQHTWTFSTWMKPSKTQGFYGAGSGQSGQAYDLFEGGTGNNQFWLYDDLNFYGEGYFFSTRNIFTDKAAWYHVVLSVSTALSGTDKIRLWVNGSQITDFDQDFRSQWPTAASTGQTSRFNSANSHSIGGGSTITNFFDGYMAETYFVDGQSLTADSFGQVSSVTGTWIPKKYSGTYGNNGFYVNYSNSSNLGLDYSGRGNNFTKNGDAFYSKDIPYPYTKNTDFGNYATWDVSNRFYDLVYKGNTRIQTSTGNAMPATIFTNSGKWYWEVKWVSGANPRIGVTNINGVGQDLGGSANSWCRLNSPSRVYNAGSAPAYGTDLTVGDTIMVALDIDAGRIWYGKNGTWEASGNPAAGTNPSQTFTSGQTMSPAIGSGGGSPLYDTNFGSLGFTYTPPSGFKPLNTSNISEPTIKKSISYFKTSRYVGNGTSQAITGLGFSPDLVMIRSRAGASTGVHDTQRTTGGIPVLYTDSSVVESAGGSYLSSFNSDGYTLNNNSSGNNNGTNYVGWAWEEAAQSGFDIVTYTGNGSSAQAISHNLGAVPNFIIIKPRSFADSWFIWHSGFASGKSARFSTAVPEDAFAFAFGNTQPTSTQFYVGGNGSNFTSATGQQYVAYLWTQIPGFSRFGTYIGNGITNGPFINLGFKPAWILIKNVNSAEQWAVMDNERPPIGNNETGNFIPLQSGGAEDTNPSFHQIDRLSNGFKIRGQAQQLINLNGDNYIYAAFAESPFKYSIAR
jgi:hypothetical protein